MTMQANEVGDPNECMKMCRDLLNLHTRDQRELRLLRRRCERLKAQVKNLDSKLKEQRSLDK
jgi:predicted component of type VI protein secretion system